MRRRYPMNRSQAVALQTPLWLAVLVLLLGGCATNPRANIPANASNVASGNDRLSYTPASDGRVWIYDKTNDRIIYSGKVGYNQTVVVDPDQNEVRINDHVAAQNTLTKGSTFVIYFVAGDNSAM